MPSLVAEACGVLGLDPGPRGTPPDEEAVASAFKKLAIKWHPDRNPDNVKEATQRFAEISAARDLLLDPPTNALLDEPMPKPAGAVDQVELEDIDGVGPADPTGALSHT